MGMPGRKYTFGSEYRYGFNGQEKTQEVAENLYTAEFWQYDGRIGRRWNVDPIVKPNESPYLAFAGNPIWFNDVNGADTTLPAVGGGTATLPDEARRSIETYGSGGSTITGTSIPVPVQQGQLRSFSLDKLGKFSAKWKTDDNGNAVFAGYLDEKNRDVASATKDYNAKVSVDNFFKSADNFFSNPGNQALLIATPILMQNAMFKSGRPSAGNPSVVTTTVTEAESLMTISFSAQNTARAGVSFAQGSFSVFNWQGYPVGGVKPLGPFRLLVGKEYTAARNLANTTNAAMRRADPVKFSGLQIHEINPVKFGGSPTDPANKIFLRPSEHAQYTNFWNSLMRGNNKF